MDPPLKTWLWRGMWAPGFIIMVVQSNDYYLAFYYDGMCTRLEGKAKLENQKESWELAS